MNQAYGERAAMRGDAAREGFTLCDGKFGLRFRSDNKVIPACRTTVLARMLALILLARLPSYEATEPVDALAQPASTGNVAGW
jgi:hypothetical protein